LSDYV
jgi:hypothetical protein